MTTTRTMNSFIAIFLLAFQAVCDGAPGHKYPVPHLPEDVALDEGYLYDEGYIVKRALCTDEQKDKSSGCSYWKSQGYCASTSIYHTFMMANCYATCGHCELPPTTPPTLDWDACLDAHNGKRALHGASPLAWSNALEQDAQEWADYLLSRNVQPGEQRLIHENGTGQGENLYWGKASSYKTCLNAVDSWYAEVADYDFDNPPNSIFDVPSGVQIGHFTQIVWKATTTVGVALASGKGDDGLTETYIVARYSPPGNVQGQLKDNVEKASQ